MKARKRNTNNEWGEVEYVQLKNSYVITKADQMEFDIPSNTESEESHWQDVRERAVIAAMQGLLSNPSKTGSAKEYAEAAIDYTDALIEELKKK